MKKICVLETNEVPVRVWEEYATRHRAGLIARLLRQGKLYTTLADDIEKDRLYPSQTWASLNTGMAFEEHQIYWYNDPKGGMDRFWWHQAAMQGRRVGLVNVLHSSPLAKLLAEADYAFVLPDCFASDDQTFPAQYRPFQSLNLQLTRKNGRVSSSGPADLIGTAIKATGHPTSFGLTPFTMRECLRAVPQVARSRERLRGLQFPPLASIFLGLSRKTDPDVAVFFTNHIAAAQHRYWYGLFPQDYAETLYEPQWLQRHRNDIMDAVALLERYLVDLVQYCQRSDRIFMMVSSMGQHANARLTRANVAAHQRNYRLDDPVRLLTAAIGPNDAQALPAMVPQYTFGFPDATLAQAAALKLAAWIRRNPAVQASKLDLTGSKLTLSLCISDDLPTSTADGKHLPLTKLGVTAFEVEDHHSGCHHGEGALLVYNDREDELFPSDETPRAFSYLRYAQELRRYLQLDPNSHMQIRPHATQMRAVH